MTDSNSNIAEKGDGVNLKEIVFRYLSYWKWFLLSIILFLGLAYFHLYRSPNIYSTESKIQILDPSSSGIELPSSSFVFKSSKINLENEINALQSYSIVEKVVEKLDLNFSFYGKGRINTPELDKFPLDFSVNDTILPNQYGNYSFDFDKKNMTITTNTGKIIKFDSCYTGINNQLPFVISNKSNLTLTEPILVNVSSVKNKILSTRNSISISKVGKASALLGIKLNGENPKKSRRIINTLIEVYKQDGINDRQQVSKSTIEFIDKRFGLIQNQLDSVEVAKESYKKSQGLGDIKEDVTFNLRSLTEIDEQYYTGKRQLKLTESISDALNDKENLERLPVNIIEGNGLNGLISKYNTTLDQYNRIALNGGENNPSLLYAKQQLENDRININSSLNAYLRDLKTSLKDLEKRKNKFESIRYTLPTQEKNTRSIERQLNITETLYLFLLQKREEAAINLAVTEPSVKVIEYALSSSVPISPKPQIIYLAAFAIGLLLPFTIIYARFVLDTKIHNKEDLADINPETPVIGEIPNIDKNQKDLFDNPNSNNVLSESFRILSSNANYMLPKGDGGKVILSTSTIKGEGKTFISLNLSLALSSINKKVLLIGADLRNPQIHKQIGVDKNSQGLSNYLYQDDFSWKDALINGFEKHHHHHILLSGTIPPNPTHLLTNGKMKELVEEARNEYDYIIIDSAPTILVTDTLLISNLVDATVFVVRADYTEKKLLNFSKDLYESGKLKNLGYIVNGVGANKSYGYGYRYGYNYGYGYGYGSEDED